MRTERQMLDLILSTAKEDDRIRAVILEGSRTNPNAPKDLFQDYDVVYVVGETESFQKDKGWIDRFGQRLYMQYPEDHPVYPSDREHCYGWLMQFADGNRLDLHVSTPDWVLENDAKDSLFSVLLDKDGLFADRTPADDSAHWVQKPTQALFSATCNEFWWCLNNLCKGLWRQEVSYAQWVMNDLLRCELLTMLSWKAAFPHDFRISVGKCGKYLHRFLEKTEWETFLSTYSSACCVEMWEAGAQMCDLFHQTAQNVAENLGFSYDLTEAENSRGFFDRVRQLPRDAKEIF